jgi:hypothetical protein
MIIGKINIDFKILSPLDPSILMIADYSDWFSAENSQSVISIYPPGSTKAVTNTFTKNKINTFNSTNLGLTCVVECGDQPYIDLNDGIWKIVLKSAFEGLEKTRYYLKTDRFMVEWYKEWINVGLTYNKAESLKYDALMDARKHLITAKAHTVYGNFTYATREFQEAQKKFNKIRKCKDCL